MADSSSPSTDRKPHGFVHTADHWILVAMESIVLALVCLSPWAFGAVEPNVENLLFAALAFLLILWAVRILVVGTVELRKCPVSLCLAGLVLLGIGQVISLPRDLIKAISPETVRTYDQYLPSQPEVLPYGEPSENANTPPGTTLSLYSSATGEMLFRIVCILLLFSVVRNNLTSPAAFRRLSVVALLNGTLLALLAIAQYFSSPQNVLYWTFPSPGRVFGPFICRNHFPFYLNVCIGLGIGAFLSVHAAQSQKWRRDLGSSREAAGRSGSRMNRHMAGPGSITELLQNPEMLAMSLAIALMFGSVALSLSRGGLIVLFCAGLGAMGMRMAGPPRTWMQGTGLLVAVGVALTLVAWLGFDSVQNRLGTVLDGSALEGRSAMWGRGLTIAADFPLSGTGYGTFRYVEPMHRNAADPTFDYEYAHNDYLEALVEGGIPRLVISLLAIAFLFRLGFRAYSANRGLVGEGLALGGLFGVTTWVLHSFGDFGLHIPAIAVLAAVVSAHLCSLSEYPRVAAQPAANPHTFAFKFWGVAPVIASVGLCMLALSIFATGMQMATVHQLFTEANKIRVDTDEEKLENRIALLDFALELDPESASLRLVAGQAHLQAVDLAAESLDRRSGATRAVQLVAALAPGDLLPLGHGNVLRWFTMSLGDEIQTQGENEQMSREHLVPALRHILVARDQSPLLPASHRLIAANTHRFEKAEAISSYLTRAKLLAPNDPEAWYFFGLQESVNGDLEAALKSWRRSLEISDQYVREIVTSVAKIPDFESLLAVVLPNRSPVLVGAAFHLYPKEEQSAERMPLLERALKILDDMPPALGADSLRLRGKIQASLGRSDVALKSYESALLRQPGNIEWRFELAKLFHQEKRLQDARRELLTILAQQPGHGPARELQAIVARDIAIHR